MRELVRPGVCVDSACVCIPPVLKMRASEKLGSVDIYTRNRAAPKRSQRPKYSMMYAFFLLPFRKGHGVSFVAPFRT